MVGFSALRRYNVSGIKKALQIEEDERIKALKLEENL
jgi:hypothetical protein